MSKSKKNTIDPEEMIKNYGADAVRLFILSDSPPEKDVQWSEQGMLASYKFIQKFWLLHRSIKEKLLKETEEMSKKKELEFLQFINQLINKITKNLESFHYNVIVANFHETYNFLINIIKEPIDRQILLESYLKILKIMSPVIPHITSECLQEMGEKTNVVWPKVDKKYIEKTNRQIVVQINGKKRGLFETNKEMNEKQIIDVIKLMPLYEKYFNNVKVTRTIYVKNKLINLIIK